jgi:Transposase DDE domain
MRANGIVRHVLRGVSGEIHRARLEALYAAVLALIHGGQIGLAALGRAIGPRSYKNGIKRIDRLLGNRALVGELEAIYAAITRYVLRSNKRPVILLDWTDAGDEMCALTAAVPMQGRAITIYSVTVPKSRLTSPSIEKAFLEKLRTFLCPACRPVLVGDAGFRAPWMKWVKAMGWDFVTRVRGRTLVQRAGEPHWQHWKQLVGEAGSRPRSLGSYRIVRNHGVEAQLVVVDRRAPIPRSITPRNSRAMRATRAHHEPWFLATSLPLPAKQIVGIYAKRMQIELTFRDLKSHRFGWGFEDARCRSTARVAVQIILAAIASLVLLLVGMAAEAAGLRRRFQANTITKRRVLSLVALGRAVINSGNDERLRLPRPMEWLRFVGIP